MRAVFPANPINYSFKGLWDLPSKCGLRIFDKDGKTVVLVSELYQENPGTAIAQVSASLAMQICAEYEIDYKDLVYIEHNPDMNSKLSFYDEELFLVHFEQETKGLKNPFWERLSTEQVKQYVDVI